MMHRSTTSPRSQSFDETKVIMHFNQHILCYVGMGWFSLACCRVRNWPFWSHSVFLFEQMRRSIADVAASICFLLSSYAPGSNV
jgi:hypothetical protein